MQCKILLHNFPEGTEENHEDCYTGVFLLVLLYFLNKTT
jgi:hypothetical protein